MPSVLTQGQKRLFGIIGFFTVFILANSVYLYLNNPKPRNSELNEQRYEVSTYGMAGSQEIVDSINLNSTSALSPFYQSMLLLHIVIGLGLFLIVAGFVVWHLKNALKRRNIKAITMGGTLAAAAVLITLSGLFILTEANSIQNRWIFHGHRILALLIPLIYIAHRLASHTQYIKRHIAVIVGVVGILFALMTVLHHGTMPELEEGYLKPIVSDPNPGTLVVGDVTDPYIPFEPDNIGKKDSPFFPSRVTTESGELLDDSVLTQSDYVHQDRIDAELEQYGFLVSETIGSKTCARCHAGIVEQWSKSAHRFSSFNNPFYKASIDNLREQENGVERSQWCAGCHDPALLFTGNMKKEIDPFSPLAQAGLTCLSCHIIDKLHGKEGNGNYNLASQTPSTYLFAETKSGVPRLLGDMIMKSKPTVHKSRMLKPFFRSSEYCMTCHKVSLDEPVNHYRWIRGQNEYDNWHDSGVALNAARTFYLPSKKRSCQDCHMPQEPVTLPDVSAKNGRVKSHRFVAVNTALPYIRGDFETIERIETYLQNDTLSVDIFAVSGEDGFDTTPLKEDEPFAVTPGETVQIEVVVRNRNVGHTFPGGTNDSNEGWIAFTITDENGDRMFESGSVRPDGHVDPKAHFYKALFVDKNSEPAMKRNAQDFHVLVYARVIGPGTADVVRFRFNIPKDATGKELRVSAKLMWRKFNQSFNRFVFDNEKVPDVPHLEGKKYPDLPITEIASDTKILEVKGRSDEQPVLDAGDWTRYNDFGIANFLQNDLQSSEWAFQQVARVAPDRLDGPRNLARIAITEGRLDDAFRYLETCEKMKPGDPQTAWFWGLARHADGRYQEAVNAYKRVVAYFPEDRAAWRNLGQSYYKNGQYEEALQAFMEVLKIDPEDRAAHYNRMLIYRAVGKTSAAAEAERAYIKYKLDENAEAVSQQYRLENPADNNASQRIIVYDLKPLPLTRLSSITE